MKKALALLLSLAMIVSVIVLPTAVSAEMTGLQVVAQDYEGSAIESAYFANSSVTTEKAHSGSRSVKLKNEAWKQSLVPLGSNMGGNAEKFIIDFWIWADSSVNFNNLSTIRAYALQLALGMAVKTQVKVGT